MAPGTKRAPILDRHIIVLLTTLVHAAFVARKRFQSLSRVIMGTYQVNGGLQLLKEKINKIKPTP
jgi:hypothetical protein